MRLNWPPNWPQPPEGWTPPPGWQPDPSWGPAPAGWEFWVEDTAQESTSQSAPPIPPAPGGSVEQPTDSYSQQSSQPYSPPPTQPPGPQAAPYSPAPSPSYSQPPTQPPGQQTAPYPQPPSTPPSNSRGPLIAIGIIAGLVLIGGLVAAIIFLTDDGPDEATPTATIEPTAQATTQTTQPEPSTQPAEPTTQATSNGDPTEMTVEIGEEVSGVGNAVVHVNGAIDAYLVMNVEYLGTAGTFELAYQDGLTMYSSWGATALTTLFNVTTDTANEETLVISSSGPWTLSFTDLWQQPEYDPAVGASGNNTTVLLAQNLTADAPVTFSSDDLLSPGLYAVSETDTQALVEEDSGPMSQATTIPQDTVVLVVVSDGTWSMTP